MATSREAAAAELERLHQEFLRLLERVPDGDWEVPRTIGDGDWSVRDLVGHVASWERRALEGIRACRESRKPNVPWGDLDEMNAESIRRDRAIPLEELRREAGETHAELVREIRALDEATWEAELELGPDMRDALGNFVGQMTGADDHPYGHLTAHLPDLRVHVESLASA